MGKFCASIVTKVGSGVLEDFIFMFFVFSLVVLNGFFLFSIVFGGVCIFGFWEMGGSIRFGVF